MLSSLTRRIFGSANDRYLKTLQPIVRKINEKEKEVSALSDAELQARTPWFRDRLQKGETLDNILIDAFATVREASKRVLGMRHFDVQLLGGIVLHRGSIAEMRTGEGKTLVATLPMYLNALEGKGAHLVTVNDYLASRDSEWMGQLYRFMGLTVGCITGGLSDHQRQVAYGSDITYGTNNEFGFDYLRDNMKFHLQEMVQRPFNYAIVDEVDSILIDEARTPLIISGPAQDSSDMYTAVNALIPLLKPEDFEKDEKARSVLLTEQGVQTMEDLLKQAGLMKGDTLYDVHNVGLVHHVNQALKAHQLFRRDTDYIVFDDKVVIIDEFTGRMMDGRRYSDGLHQALEAKENVTIQNENQTLASITFQNYFRMYPKLAGMTGSGKTEAQELMDIYKLDVVEITTNVPVQRKDLDDEVYRTNREKYEAIIKLIRECRERRQPVLVGTVSIEKSEVLSALLTKEGIEHKVLNARQHAQEATIIEDAGVPGAVTIATNMAGRGTDIKLGGNLEMKLHAEGDALTPERERELTEQNRRQAEEVKAAGGLYVIGTERHESRRIDNQLRGRSGRQGDPGTSKFFLCLEDDLMRIFGSERLDSMLLKLGLEEGEAITHPWVNKALERAQQKVEARNYDIRKQLLKYDDVMNDQRKIIYEQRKEIMASHDLHEDIEFMREECIQNMVTTAMPPQAYAEAWNVDLLHADVLRVFSLDLPIQQWAQEEGIANTEIEERIRRAVNELMTSKESGVGRESMAMIEKSLMLRLLDQSWKEHLHGLDRLRQGINLRAYGQRDPLNEYKREAYGLFEEMMETLQENITSVLAHLDMNSIMGISEDDMLPHAPMDSDVRDIKQGTPYQDVASTDVTDVIEIPSNRNAPCPCGSGEKFKNCHGKLS